MLFYTTCILCGVEYITDDNVCDKFVDICNRCRNDIDGDEDLNNALELAGTDNVDIDDLL